MLSYYLGSVNDVCLGFVVWHLSLPLMNIFNKTEADIFPCRICFLRAFRFLS